MRLDGELSCICARSSLAFSENIKTGQMSGRRVPRSMRILYRDVPAAHQGFTLGVTIQLCRRRLKEWGNGIIFQVP